LAVLCYKCIFYKENAGADDFINHPPQHLV
ncbi:hypothetical protein M2454_003037, partial [Aequitasia blattaphilus]